jgi:hypothetical protein
MIAVGSSLQHNGETHSARVQNTVGSKAFLISLDLLLLCSSPHLLPCTFVLVGAQHNPSMSTAFLAKPQIGTVKIYEAMHSVER